MVFCFQVPSSLNSFEYNVLMKLFCILSEVPKAIISEENGKKNLVNLGLFGILFQNMHKDKLSKHAYPKLIQPGIFQK